VGITTLSLFFFFFFFPSLEMEKKKAYMKLINFVPFFVFFKSSICSSPCCMRFCFRFLYGFLVFVHSLLTCIVLWVFLGV
jgi:hypothetical protein